MESRELPCPEEYRDNFVFKIAETATENHSVIFINNSWQFANKKESVESHYHLCPEDEKDNSEFESVETAIGNDSTNFLNNLWPLTDKKESVESHDPVCHGEEKSKSTIFLSFQCSTSSYHERNTYMRL